MRRIRKREGKLEHPHWVPLNEEVNTQVRWTDGLAD
jgi:hypothetical protein